MSAKEKDEQKVLIEIDQVTTKLKKNPKNLNYVCRLASLHLDDNKVSRSQPYMMDAIKLYQQNKDATIKQGIELTETMLKFWRAEKYLNKQERRTNFSSEREQFLNQTHDITKHVIAKKDVEFAHLLSLRMAYIKECKGEFQESLALLSDLIAEQAMDHVDLSYIIFKAAIVLMHIGQPKQAIEYLEFIMDDPPAQDGFAKTHLCAFLVHVYEQSGDKYKVFLPKTYKELQQACSADMPAAYSKLLRAQGKGGFGQSSELWEMLALQALDKCEYVLAAEFLVEAISKVPGKVKLMHLLAEIYTLLKQKAHAKACAEQAYDLNPQSSELRNLLLQVAPEEWTEKLRILSSTSNTRTATLDTGGSGENEIETGEISNAYAPPSAGHYHPQNAKLGGSSADGYAPGGDAPAAGGIMTAPPTSSGYKSAEKEQEEAAAQESSSWVAKMRSKASGALKAMHSGAISSPNMKKNSLSSPSATNKDEPTFSPVSSPSKPNPAVTEDIQIAPTSANNEINKPLQRWLQSSGSATAEKQEDAPTSARPKSRSSFMSMLMPLSSPASTPAVHRDESQDAEAARPKSPEPARPKSRSSFISKIIPSSFRSPASSTSPEKVRTSSDKLSPTKLVNSLDQNPQQSPSHKFPQSPSSSNKNKGASPIRGGASSPVKLPSKVVSKPKPKKITKYDTTHHVSKLAVEDDYDGNRAKKPERPVIDEEERKLLKLILNGNENVPVYDPNLLFLQQLRLSSKKFQERNDS